MESGEAVSGLLCRIRQGDGVAWSELLDRVYPELRRLAAFQMRGERPNHTLQPTALVHQCYLRMVDGSGQGWENRAHFFAAAADLMRKILVDHARKRRAEKRGGGHRPIALDDAQPFSEEKYEEILALDAALSELAAIDGRKAKVVEMRYFAGMTAEETAEAVGATVRTVNRDWAFARAWLHKRFGAERSAAG